MRSRREEVDRDTESIVSATESTCSGAETIVSRPQTV
jgi:hypothetical protein